MSRTLVIASLFLLVLPVACKHEDAAAQLPPSPAPVKDHATTPKTEIAPLPNASPDSPSSDIRSGSTSSAFFSGTLEAHRRSTLTPKVSSTVTRVHVRDGDRVKEGQSLVTLDTQDFALRTQQAEAGLQAAKVQLDLAKLEWTRTKALLADKAVPQSQFDMLDARYKGAEANVAQAETAVAMGRKALRDAILRAPFHGLVVKRLVNEGEYASVMPATPMVILEEVNPIDLRIQLPSTEMEKVNAGTQVRVRFPASGQTMDLQLTRIVAAMDPRSRTFSAIVEIPNPDYALRTGLYAEVTLSPKKATQTALAAPAKPKKAIRAKKD